MRHFRRLLTSGSSGRLVGGMAFAGVAGNSRAAPAPSLSRTFRPLPGAERSQLQIA
jgi:hypothetical protein